MRKTIQDIIGAKIQGYIEICDYKQLITDKAIINIYNPYKYYSLNKKYFDICEINGKDLADVILINIEFIMGKYLKIELDNKNVIEITLNEEDYMGPEAISIHYCTGEIIVF